MSICADGVLTRARTDRWVVVEVSVSPFCTSYLLLPWFRSVKLKFLDLSFSAEPFGQRLIFLSIWYNTRETGTCLYVAVHAVMIASQNIIPFFFFVIDR